MESDLSSGNLENELELFIENMRQINIMVADFQPQAQTALNQKIQKIVTDLCEIDKLKNQVQDVQIPIEVFDYIDNGRNPQIYTKDCMIKTLSKNEEVKGKIDAYKKFKAHMLLEFTQDFPKEMERYRAIRDDEDDE